MDYTAILIKHYPDVAWQVSGETYDGIIWPDKNKPSKTTLDALWEDVDADKKSERILQKQKQILTSCDWTQLADVDLTEEEKTAWTKYRQAVRDVNNQDGFPENVTWPEKPE